MLLSNTVYCLIHLSWVSQTSPARRLPFFTGPSQFTHRVSCQQGSERLIKIPFHCQTWTSTMATACWQQPAVSRQITKKRKETAFQFSHKDSAKTTFNTLKAVSTRENVQHISDWPLSLQHHPPHPHAHMARGSWHPNHTPKKQTDTLTFEISRTLKATAAAGRMAGWLSVAVEPNHAITITAVDAVELGSVEEVHTEKICTYTKTTN